MEKTMLTAKEAHAMSEEMLKNNPEVKQAFSAITDACRYGYYRATIAIERKKNAEFVSSVLKDWGYQTNIRFGCTMWHIDITW